MTFTTREVATHTALTETTIVHCVFVETRKAPQTSFKDEISQTEKSPPLSIMFSTKVARRRYRIGGRLWVSFVFIRIVARDSRAHPAVGPEKFGNTLPV